MKRALLITGLLMAATTAMGCTESMSSTDVRTHGIAASFTVEAGNADSSTVRAVLRAGGKNSNTYITLDNGDKLRVEANGQNVPMTAYDEGHYQANIGTGAADTEYKVIFERGQDDDGAPDNIGKLPKPFDITGVPDNSPSRKDDDVTIKWDNAGSTDSMDLEIDGDCIFKFHKSVPDTGEYIIPKGSLDSTGGKDPKSCNLTVVMKRSRAGSTDSHLNEDSSFVLSQRRATKFMSAP